MAASRSLSGRPPSRTVHTRLRSAARLPSWSAAPVTAASRHSRPRPAWARTPPVPSGSPPPPPAATQGDAAWRVI
eukprot:86966-Prymnesium_polylepis.2